MTTPAAQRSGKRLLLIEDDASLQRFVTLALDDVIEVLAVDSVDEGLAALRDTSFDVVISDLMLPGRSGFDLVEEVAATPALLASARLVIFSAGLEAETRQRLQHPQVWRLLSKPCTVAQLQACVRDALASVHAQEPQAAAADNALPEDEHGAIGQFFGGDEHLYRAFRASCVQQFPADLTAGDRALATGDLATLRHLAHSLKSVLLSLGHASASTEARLLENACAAADAGSAGALWPALRDRVMDLR